VRHRVWAHAFITGVVREHSEDDCSWPTRGRRWWSGLALGFLIAGERPEPAQPV